MNKEIKEILELIIDEKRSDRFGRIMLEITKGKLLLDYITILQEKYNKALSDLVEESKTRIDLQKENKSLNIQLDFIEEQNKYIDKLEKKIKNLQEQLSATEKVSAEYIKRCDKAIEYINRLDKDYDINVYQEDKHWAMVLYILQGSDKE